MHVSDIIPLIEYKACKEQKKIQVRNINELVHQGQDIVAGCERLGSFGTKETRLTTNSTLLSRYLVFNARTSHVEVLHCIDSKDERERLKQIMSEYPDGGGGVFIICTAAEGIGSDFFSDTSFLKNV